MQYPKSQGGEEKGEKQKSTNIRWCFFVARLKGLEPPTYWFVASHSIQLSYKRIGVTV